MISQKVIEDITEKVFDKIKTELGLYKKDLIFETEAVLRTYSYNKIMIKKNKDRIQDILENGLQDEKVKINIERVQGGIIEYKGIPEKEIERISFLEEENIKLEKRLIRVENALSCIESDPYYPIIELRFIREHKWEEIEKELKIDRKTIRRQKNKLMRKLSQLIFQEILYNEKLDNN